MHSFHIHEVINRMISLFYRIGFWHRSDAATIKQLRMKLFYCIYHVLFVISLLVGAFLSDDKDHSIFLAEIGIIGTVLSVKLWILIWKQNGILQLLNRICIFSIRSDDDFVLVNEILSGFFKFVISLLIYLMVADLCVMGVAPFIGSERTLFFKVAFPLDWRNNGISFWVANIFVFTGLLLSMAAFTLSIIIWYLLLVGSLRYKELSNELKELGLLGEEGTGNDLENTFLQDCKASVDAHLEIWEYGYVLANTDR